MNRSRKWLSTLVIACVANVATFSPAAPPATAPSARPAARGARLPPGVKAVRDLHYGDAPARANLLDLYLPENAVGKLPLVVFIHGGGWTGGDKLDVPPILMVTHQYVVASINYRFSQEAKFPAQILDCKGAVRWLRAHAADYGIDPDRIGAWGPSAGGHLVALLGTSGGAKELEGDVGGNLDQSSRVQAVCDWFGPTDMLQFFPQARDNNVYKPHPHRSPIEALFGGPVDEHKDLVALANPITFVSKTTPPFLIEHGDRDKLVPLGQSQLLADALNAAGVECEFRVVKGAGHGDGFGKPEVQAVAKFFDRHLGDNSRASTRPSGRDLH